MTLKRIINSPRGKILIAVLLGFGLSTLFRKACKDSKCMDFKAPPIDKINGQMYEYNTKCYTFESKTVDCDNKRKTISFA